MANELKIIIGADGRPLKTALSDASRDLRSFSSLLTGIGVGVGIAVFEKASEAIAAFVEGSIKEFQEAQRSVVSLRQSLESVGRSDVFTKIISQAEELQNKFQYLGGSDITSGFQRLIQYGGLTEDQIRRLIPVIIDLNATQRLAGETNKTIASTADLVVRGLEGQGRELKKYGIEVKASNSSTENLNIILGTLATKVKGAGDAFGNTLEGKIAITTERVNDLQEALGGKLLPLKAKLYQFAIEVADGFALISDRINRGTSNYEDWANARARAQFSDKNSDATLEKLKDLSVADLTSELISYTNVYENFKKEINKPFDPLNPLAATAPLSDTLQFEEIEKLIPKIKELIRVKSDSSTVGIKDADAEGKAHKKTTDALKIRIAALKELIAAGVDVKGNALALKGLEIELIQRDGAKKGLTQEEIKKLIQARFPEFSGEGLTLSQPIVVTAPVQIKSVAKEIEKNDPVGDNLVLGIQRMYDRIATSGTKDGEKARKAVNASLQSLTSSINSTLSNAGVSIAESLGNAFGGQNPIAAFLSVIATALQELGKALVAYGIAKKIAIDALKSLNPFVSIAAGVAAIAAGALLKQKLSNPTRLAEGGVVDRPTIAMFGEAGREVVMPLNKLNSIIGERSGAIEVANSYVSGDDIVQVWRSVSNKNGRKF